MLRFAVLALASLVVSAAPTAQTFPEPGTGAFMRRSAEPAEAAFVVASSPAPDVMPTLAEVSVRPNPSAGAPVVVVSLARPAEVTAEVTDALGRTVAALGGGAWPA